ncbi:MAG: DUF4159 domain-containing protein [Blastocatellia bacterium]
MRKIVTLMRTIILIIIALASTLLPGSLRAAGGTAEKAFHYDDARLGEKKDQSDKFKFARVKLAPMYSGAFLGDRGEPWSHDYPEAGQHFSKILAELSKLPVVLDEDEYVFAFDDPNLMKYPFAYMCEVGHMELTDKETAGMREYLLRGGFLLVDDFRSSYEMRTFEYYFKRAFPEPEYQMKTLDVTHPIFNCFFTIKSLDVHAPYGRYRPEFLGVEDKHGRLMMIINYNNDVSDYWQWSNDPFMPIDDTNSAYKFGVNYVFYALTH